jgi:hypothetical protein
MYHKSWDFLGKCMLFFKNCFLPVFLRKTANFFGPTSFPRTVYIVILWSFLPAGNSENK